MAEAIIMYRKQSECMNQEEESKCRSKVVLSIKGYEIVIFDKGSLDNEDDRELLFRAGYRPLLITTRKFLDVIEGMAIRSKEKKGFKLKNILLIGNSGLAPEHLGISLARSACDDFSGFERAIRFLEAHAIRIVGIDCEDRNTGIALTLRENGTLRLEETKNISGLAKVVKFLASKIGFLS